MTIKNFKKLAGIGAIALGSLVFASYSNAAVINSGGFVTIAATTTVNNQLDVVITPLAFGTFGTVHDVANVDTATATVSLLNVFTQDLAGPAKIIDGGGAHTAATVTITAFPSTRLYADYTNVTNIVGTVTPAHILTVTDLADNLGAPNTGTGGTNGTWSSTGPTAVQGKALTNGAGSLVFRIGGTIVTAAATTYNSEAYSGSFDLTLSY